MLSTTPNDYYKPLFIYISTTEIPEERKREYASTQLGINYIFIHKSNLKDGNLYIRVSSIENTIAKLKTSLVNEIKLEEYKAIRPKLKLKDISNSNLISFNYNKTEYKNTKKILIYSLGENVDYFNMEVKYTSPDGIKIRNFDVKQRFENGYGAIIDFNLNTYLL